MQPVYKSLTWVLLSDSMPDSTWYTAAEAAVTAIYALHPAPQELAQVSIHRLGKLAFQGGGSNQDEAGAKAAVCFAHTQWYSHVVSCLG